MLDVLAKGGVELGEIALPRPRHDGRHQRADRAQGRRDGADHDRGLPRRRSRSRAATGPTSSTCIYEKPTPFVPRYLRREVPGRLDATTASERKPLDLSRPAGDPRRLPRPRASRRSRSASCTPTPTRRTSRRCSPSVQRAVAGGVGRRLAPDHPRVARVRAHQHRRAVGLCPADRRALSGRLHDGLRGRRLRRPARTSCSRTAASTRSSARQEIPITMVESGPGVRLLGRGRARPADRRAERARARHRRHDREVLADRERRTSRS